MTIERESDQVTWEMMMLTWIPKWTWFNWNPSPAGFVGITICQHRWVLFRSLLIPDTCSISSEKCGNILSNVNMMTDRERNCKHHVNRLWDGWASDEEGIWIYEFKFYFFRHLSPFHLIIHQVHLLSDRADCGSLSRVDRLESHSDEEADKTSL